MTDAPCYAIYKKDAMTRVSQLFSLDSLLATMERKRANIKVVGCYVFALQLLAVAVSLIIIGSIFMAKERPKVLHYANTMCEVDSRSWKIYTCSTRYGSYTCYGPTWEVHHGEYRTTSATVEGETRYRSYSDALKKAYEYQVS